MSDATEKGGAMASIIRQIKKKEDGYIRIDKQKAWDYSEKLAGAKGSVRKQPHLNKKPTKLGDKG